MRIGTVIAVCALVLALTAGAFAGAKTRYGVDVTEWSSDTVLDYPSILPVGGSGQVNGDFVTAERNGVQVGLRASRRFSQNVDPLESYKDKKRKIAVYLAETGTSDGLGRAVWNYDVHVDLRGGKGVMAGRTLGDFDLLLDTDIGATLFGLPVPLDIPLLYALGAVDTTDTLLLQTSQNPKFGNPAFDATAEGVYSFTLSLIPKTFNGPPISVEMEVVVSNP